MSEEYAGIKFTTFFGDKAARAPAIADDIVELGRELAARGLAKSNAGNISVKIGNRIAITAAGKLLGTLSRDDVVEVADYDPVRNVAVVLGTREPSSETPMHWLIHKNRRDVNVIAHVHDDAVMRHADHFIATELAHPYGTLELALDVLKALRAGNYVIIKNHGSVAVGATFYHVKELIFEAHDKAATLK